jgi:hypothetical protein
MGHEVADCVHGYDTSAQSSAQQPISVVFLIEMPMPFPTDHTHCVMRADFELVLIFEYAFIDYAHYGMRS